jgi:hypothetical protein
MHKKIKKVSASPDRNKPKTALSRNITVIMWMFGNNCLSFIDSTIEISVIMPRISEKNQESGLIWNICREPYELVKIRKSIFKFS